MMNFEQLTILSQDGTQFIIADCDLGFLTWPHALEECDKLNKLTNSNWRLPTCSELKLMYNQLHENGLGHFEPSYYWSSEEVIEPSFNLSNWTYQDHAPVLPNPYAKGCEFEFFGHVSNDSKGFEHFVRLVK
jgi:hypothetical protein